ncbi:MAG: CsbD family protein [Sulfuricaulis sp.]
MNWDTAKSNWTLFKGNVKLQWGNLTHDHLSKLAGRHDQFAGKIQKTYAATKQATEEQVKGFIGPRQHRGPRI